MAYAYPGAGALDYSPCRYGNSKLLFRGPQRPLDGPYCAVLGGTEAYGKFIPFPYPALVEVQTGLKTVNLGCVNAGPDAYLNDPEVLEIATNARLTIVQLMGAQNQTNRFYSVHPRRNDRFLSASPWLRTIYREVDFTEFHFTRHMLQTLQDVSPDRFDVVAEELRAVWVGRMQDLLGRLRGKTLLLWMADHAPLAAVNLFSDPLLVDADMIAAVRQHATAYLEVVISPEARSEGVENMRFSQMERPAAEGMPGPLAHGEVALAVSAAVNRLLDLQKGAPL